MKLEVGKSYRNRIGRVQDICETFPSLRGEPCFRDTEGTVYDECGRINELRKDPQDLISEASIAA